MATGAPSDNTISNLTRALRQREAAPGLVAAMETELRQYIAGANQFDDITLLAVKRIGIGEIPLFEKTGIISASPLRELSHD